MDLASHSLTSFVEETAKASGRNERPAVTGEAAALIVLAACDAVAVLHGNKPRLIHRDINPNNLLLRQGTWMLADFGLAKFLSTAPISTLFRTSTGPGPGTQWFTAPEQYRRFLDADERADIYSLGVLIMGVRRRLFFRSDDN